MAASTCLCSGAPRPVGDLASAATSLATESIGTVLTPSQMSDIAGHEKARTLYKRTHRHKPFDHQRFLSGLWLRHAQLRAILSKYEVLQASARASSRVLADRSELVYIFVQTFVDFPLSLPGHSL